MLRAVYLFHNFFQQLVGDSQKGSESASLPPGASVFRRKPPFFSIHAGRDTHIMATRNQQQFNSLSLFRKREALRLH
jgi:hypothetical protein